MEVHRLDKYFYLTRENLKKSIADETNLSEKVRALLERIGNAMTGGQMPNIIADIKSLTAEEISDLMGVLLSKIEAGKLKLFVVKDLYVEIKDYRDKISKALLLSNQKMNPGDVPLLRAMYQEEPGPLEPTLIALLNGNKKGQSMLDDIKGIKKKEK